MNRFNGGIDPRGGGSGTNTLPPPRPRDAESDSDEDGDAAGGMFARARSQNSGRASADGPAHDPSQKYDLEVTVTMYREGFTVDDGPYRPLTDPANGPFLQSLSKGQVPAELVTRLPRPPAGAPARTPEINFRLVDRRTEDYVAPPPPSYVAFGGAGNVMAPAVSGGGGLVTPTTGLDSADEEAATEAEAAPPLSVPLASGEAVVSVQVRLMEGLVNVGSGGKLVLKCNASTTVLALVRVLNLHLRAAGAPQNVASNYFLLGGFPPKRIEDFGLSVKDAGIAGGVLSMKKA